MTEDRSHSLATTFYAKLFSLPGDKGVKDKSSLSMDEAVDETISQDVFEDLVDVLSRLDISEHLWELIDFKTFFKLCYLTSPKIKSASIAFLQQTA